MLDLSSERGSYCGKLFAEMGADVILVEPPEGSELRRQPPFLDDLPGDERSLRFAYQSASKRSAVLDLHEPEGRDAFRRLAASADLVLESFLPGYLPGLGLGYDDLRVDNPRLVMVSITPFGQTGPLADCDAPDLVCLALGGFLYLSGYVEGAPMRAPDEQAHAAASLFGAVAGMMALLHSEATGEGQHVDVSVQESVTMALENAIQFYDLEQHVRQRTGGVQKQAGTGVFRCADGFVFVMAAGIGGHRFWPNLVRWLVESAAPGADRLAGPEWSERSHLDDERSKSTFAEVFGAFALSRGKQELSELAQRYRVPLAPVNTPGEVLGSQQLAYRNYFRDILVAPGRSHPAPGAPYVLSVTPWRSLGRPPVLGQHTNEVLREVGARPLDVSSSEGA